MKSRRWSTVKTLLVLCLVLLAVPLFKGIAHAIDEIDYTGTNTNLVGDDEAGGPFNLGFTFNFYGTNYTTAYASTNGIFSFGSGDPAYSNYDLSSSSAPDNAMFPFWDDLITQAETAKSIYYTTIGTAPNRQFIMQWTNMYFYNNQSLPMGTFQVILNEGSNVIQFQYRELLGGAQSQGNSATIGIKGGSNSAYDEYSINTDSLTQGQAITFTPDGSSYTMDSNATYDPLYLVPDNVPVSPDLINPTDGTTGITTTPTFEWESVDLATSYNLLISSQSNFSSTIVNQTGLTGTSYTLGSPLSDNTTYYWKVAAVNDNGSSYSTSRSFTTAAEAIPPPDTPSNLSDANLLTGKRVNGSTLSASPLTMDLTDSASGQEVRYRLQVATDADFDDLVLDYRSPFASPGSASFTYGDSGGTYLVGSSSTALTDGQAYYVRVEAEDQSAQSSAWTGPSGVAFTYDTTAPTALAAPTLSGSATTAAADLAWKETTDSYPGSPAYRLEYANNSGFAGSGSTATNNSSVTLAGLAAGTWYARVYVTDSAGNVSAASPSLSFIVSAAPVNPSTVPTAGSGTAFTAALVTSTASTSKDTAAPVTTDSTPAPTTTTATDQTPATTDLVVQVLDGNGQPIAGAKVTLHSIPQTAYTNAAGYATFTGVVPGTHHLLAEYNGSSVEHTIQVAAAAKSASGSPAAASATVANFTLRLGKAKGPSYSWLWTILAALVLLVLARTVRRRRAVAK